MKSYSFETTSASLVNLMLRDVMPRNLAQSSLSLRQLEEMLPGVWITEFMQGHKTINLYNASGEYRCKHIPEHDFFLTPEQFAAKHLIADDSPRFKRDPLDPKRLLHAPTTK